DGGQDVGQVGHLKQFTARRTTRLARRWPPTPCTRQPKPVGSADVVSGHAAPQRHERLRTQSHQLKRSLPWNVVSLSRWPVWLLLARSGYRFVSRWLRARAAGGGARSVRDSGLPMVVRSGRGNARREKPTIQPTAGDTSLFKTMTMLRVRKGGG